MLAALAEGLWQFGHSRLSRFVPSTAGAVLVSSTAAVIGVLLLLARGDMGSLKQITFNQDTIYWILFTGLTALAIDSLSIKSYSSGLPLSVVGPIIIGGGIAIVSIIGVLLGEPITLLKILGLVLITIGASLLA